MGAVIEKWGSPPHPISCDEGPVTAIAFAKYHGLGNDFVLFDARAGEIPLSASRAIALCDRHKGIGADGVISLLPSRTKGADLRMHIYNADGSVPQMCGNGLRCLVRWALGDRLSGKLVVETDAGLREGLLLEDGRVRVTLGVPSVVQAERVVEVPSGRFEGMAVSMGNPHFVLRPIDGAGPEELLALARKIGPELERHPAFPERTNVELFAPGTDRLELVVFERGAGLTQACGTGAGATAFAARAWGLVPDGPVRVSLPGGVLTVETGAPGELSAITGEAVHVFDGTVDLASV